MWTPPADLDPEVLRLCQAINELPGLMTVESCCGHGRDPLHIYVHAFNLDALPPLLYWVDRCHTGIDGWRVTVSTDCGMKPALFTVEGPVGAYDDADRIGELITEWTADQP